MSSHLLTGPRRGAAHELRRRGGARVGRARGGLVPAAVTTLDELVCGAWEDLAAGRSTACVVCGETMEAGRGAGTGEGGGGCCAGCGSHLS